MAETYTKLEYIQSTGTQYIDTGYTPDSNTRVVAEVETATSLSANKWIFGQRSDSNTQRYEVIYIASAAAIRFYVNTSNYTFAGVGLGRLSIDVSATSAMINGVSVAPSVSTFSGARSLYICDCNSNAVSDEAIEQKVYSFKIYDNGTLVRDFVPAKRNSDGAIGLLDQANNVFYANAGTGTFTAGPEIVGTGSLANIDGTSVSLTGCIANVGGVEYAVPYALANVDGIEVVIPFGEQVSGTPVGDFAVGDTVWMNVDGTPYEWIIVHQGLPSSLYDSSCDGTWLLMKNVYEKRVWDSANNDYENSDIHAYLNGDFFGLLDDYIQNTTKQIKIPYKPGAGTSPTVNSGANGLPAKVFLLSGYEVGFTQATNQYFPIDGACLSYFNGATNATRVALMSGSATTWRLRSAAFVGTSYVWLVTAAGGSSSISATASHGVRPAMILPTDAMVGDDGFIISE